MGGELHTALGKTIDDSRAVNYLTMVNSTFFHAIILQIITYIFSIVSRGSIIYNIISKYFYLFGFDGRFIAEYLPIISWFIGTFLALYSLTLTISVLIAVYRLAMVSQRDGNA
jgi:hypothetical protein